MVLTKEQKQELINGIWSGKYNPSKLPFWLFNAIADGLEQSAVKGWGNELGAGELKDEALEKSIKENLYYFAASKTAKELEAFDAVYKAVKNKYDFTKEALKVNELYNVHWLNTEYNVTTRIARAGREWQSIEKTKEYYPKLKFVAVNDENTRDSHAALNGIVRPVDDAFWSSYFPPLAWNCRCRVERLETGANTNLSKKELPPVEEQFKERVTDSKVIWNKEHPYFKDLTKPQQKQIDSFVAKKLEKK